MDYDYDTCDATSVYQIEHGRYEDVRLDGLVAIVVLSDSQRIYLDQKASDWQKNALEEITRALTGSFLLNGIEIAKDLHIEVHPISAILSDKQGIIQIPGVLDIQSQSLTGGDGKSRIEMKNLDLGPGWMQSIWAGRSSVYTHTNGERWDHSGRNSYFGRFSASSNMPSIRAVTDARQA